MLGWRSKAHGVLSGYTSIVLLLSDGVHDVFKGVAVNADLNVVADDLSTGQSPLLFVTIDTPSVKGLRHGLWKALQHGSCTPFAGSRVAFEALLPVPASGVRHGNLLLGDKVVAIVAEVAFGAKTCAEVFLQKIDRTIGWRNVPAHGWLLLHVVLQELPKGLAEDHVIEVGDFAQNFLGKRRRYGAHKQRMSGLAIDYALKDMIFLDPDGHEQELRRQLAFLSPTESPLLTQLLLGRAPVLRQYLHNVVKGDGETKLNVKVLATMVVMVDVPEDVVPVSRLLDIAA